MVPWVARLQHRFRWRRVTTAALAVVRRREGFIARTWAVGPQLNPVDQLAIQQDALAWLTDQTALVATPYGWSDCAIIVGLARVEGSARTALWKTTPPSFGKADREQGLGGVAAVLRALPLADYPTANQLEVYLIDMGNILKQAFDHIEGA